MTLNSSFDTTVPLAVTGWVYVHTSACSPSPRCAETTGPLTR